MLLIDRRHLLASFAAPLFQAFPFDLNTFERPRILKAANAYLHENPITITAFHSPRSTGGPHDYFSEGDYWWPDPHNPQGPYIQRDGLSNPDNFVAHRHALIRLSLQMPALSAAWLLTKNRRYADHAIRHLRAWFTAPATRMNPELNYAQAIHGVTPGRGIGIIDTLQLIDVVQAIRALEPELSHRDLEALRSWFADYLSWMTTSKNGQDERDTTNNHAVAWALQAAVFSGFTRNTAIQDDCRRRFKTNFLPLQMAKNGSFPRELARTKPFGYSLFNLEIMSGLAQALSTPQDNLWTFEAQEGRSMAKAVEFLFPYIHDKSKWPYAHDVMYFDQWPIRQQSLLFACVALDKPEYLALWKRLNPDPREEEVIRNYPIRQPLLWLTERS